MCFSLVCVVFLRCDAISILSAADNMPGLFDVGLMAFQKRKKDIFLDYIIINSSSAAAAAFAFYSSRLIIIFQSGVLRRFHIIQHVILQNVYIFRRSPLILFRITFLYISIIICRNKKPKTKSPIFLRNNNKIRGYLLYMYILVYN